MLVYVALVFSVVALSSELGWSNAQGLEAPDFNGSETSSGLLEVFTEFGWSAVNYFGFGGVEAQLVCVQLGFSFAANVSILRSTWRRLDVIIEQMTCTGSEQNTSSCMVELTDKPSATDLLLVHLTCDTVHSTTDGFILFLLDSPSFTSINYPEVNVTIHSTYSMIEPGHNIYKEGCLTDVCTPGGHFHTLSNSNLERFFLPDIRNLDCASVDRSRVHLSLTGLDYISLNDCIDVRKNTDKLVISNEERFCSVKTTTVNDGKGIQAIWMWTFITLLILLLA